MEERIFTKQELLYSIKNLFSKMNIKQSEGDLVQCVYFIRQDLTKLHQQEPNYLDELHSLDLVITKEVKQLNEIISELIHHKVEHKHHPKVLEVKEEIISQTRSSIPHLLR